MDPNDDYVRLRRDQLEALLSVALAAKRARILHASARCVVALDDIWAALDVLDGLKLDNALWRQAGSPSHRSASRPTNR